MATTRLSRAGAVGISFALTSILMGATLIRPAAAEVLATVNGQQITDEDVRIASEDLGDSIPRQLEGKARDAYVLDYLIDGDLVAQKAAADKLDQDPDFAKKVAYYRDKILMESLLTKVAKEATTPANLQQTYDQAAKAQKPETEIHARHILVATQAEAEAVLKRIKSGEDFAKVAKEVSKDSAADGGDLGWFTKDRMVPQFADAAFKLDPGQISDPVHTPFGWHIIQVEGKRQTTFPPFAKVKDQVTTYVVQKAQTDMLDKLRKDAKIVRVEAGPEGTPAPGTNMPAPQAPASQSAPSAASSTPATPTTPAPATTK